MIPILPIALLGSAVYGVLHRKKVTDIAKRVDTRYQNLVRKHIDTLFNSTQRTTQMENFSGGLTEKEARFNRNLGLTVVNTGLAVLGVLLYPPLLIVNGLLLLYIIFPIIKQNLKILLYEKRIKFRLTAPLIILLNYLSGFYIIGSLILVVVFLAYKLAARTEAYSRKSLLDTFALQTPSSVWVLVEGIELEKPFAELQVNDIIVLNAGQSVPVDGVVTEGMALIDQHKLTGESQPVEKTVGDTVLASTLLLTGKIHVCVKHTGEATVAIQIGKLLNSTANYHSMLEARSERMADKTVLPVLSISGLALLVVNPIGAVTILNTGFGSNMLFSGPLTMLSYLNIASHSGILVKDGRSLELMHTIDTVVFDKTGTLTLEQPEVGRVHACQGWDEKQVLLYAAIAEHRQTHPIAKAILNEAQHQGLSYEASDHADYAIGFGIRVIWQNNDIQVGSARFMQQSQITIPENINLQQQRCLDEGHSLVFVAANGELIGAVELQAQLRPETLTVVRQLHARGLKVYILSGDQHAPTRYLAQKLEIDDFFAEILPEGKAEIIKELQAQGRKVCFVGDGINDAIALQQADVSISLRGATTIATDCAQVVLVSQSLHQLVQLFEIVEDFHANQNRTLLYAFTPGGILIAGVFLFHVGMLAALVAYTVGLSASFGNALYPLLKFNQQSNHSHKSEK